MKIKLSDGTMLDTIMVSGAQKYVDGQTRDTLTFWFAENAATMEQLDSVFSAQNCEEITLLGDEEEYRHTGYTIRDSLTKAPVKLNSETPDTPAITEMRLSVAMARRTYAETKLETVLASQTALQDAVDMLALDALLGGAADITKSEGEEVAQNV